MPIQEKNEVRLPFNDNEEVHTWTSARSARTKKGTPHGDTAFFNTLPPGSDGDDQAMADRRVQNFGGPATELTRESIHQGFITSPMSPTDEPLSGERPESFYEEITVNDKTSYVERRNTLDRN